MIHVVYRLIFKKYSFVPRLHSLPQCKDNMFCSIHRNFKPLIMHDLESKSHEENEVKYSVRHRYSPQLHPLNERCILYTCQCSSIMLTVISTEDWLIPVSSSTLSFYFMQWSVNWLVIQTRHEEALQWVPRIRGSYQYYFSIDSPISSWSRIKFLCTPTCHENIWVVSHEFQSHCAHFISILCS